jgi:nitrogen regulatory protein P-II 1
MMLVRAIIKPFKLEDVLESLRDLDVRGVTAIEVSGFGRQGGHVEIYRGIEYRIDFLPKLELEIVVTDELVDDVLAAIRDGAGTGKIGDGKIWVVPVDRVVRVRTGEEGPDAVA